MVTIKSKKEIEYMKEACKVVALMYKELEEKIKPGMTTWELDQIAENMMKKLGAIPAEKGYNVGIRGVPPYPAATCISVNDEVIDGYEKVLDKSIGINKNNIANYDKSEEGVFKMFNAAKKATFGYIKDDYIAESWKEDLEDYISQNNG